MFSKSRARRSGFTLIEIMIVVLIIGILLGIAVPNFNLAREESQQKSCVANLIQIQGAKDQWAFEHNMPETATPTDGDLFGDGTYGSGAYINQKPVCPSGGTYRLRRVNQTARCNYNGPLLHKASALDDGP